MAYLPIFVSLKGRRCVVVGGGEVAERKVAALLDAGASVCVISPTLTAGLRELSSAASIEHLPRAWQPGDIKEYALAFAATDDPRVHRAIVAEARAAGIPINVADEPDLCDFITPSVVRRGDLQIAISTAGASPALAARLRRDLEAMIGQEYETVTLILRAARQYQRENCRDPRERARVLQAIAFSNIAELVRVQDWDSIDRLLVQHLGAGLDQLGISIPTLSRGQEISRGV